MLDLTITPAEAELLVQLLRPRAELLGELFEVQVQHCPIGDDSWASTCEALQVTRNALIKVRNAQVRGLQP
jgi:hypothetical protein